MSKRETNKLKTTKKPKREYLRAGLDTYLHSFLHATVQPCTQSQAICTAAQPMPMERSLYPLSLQFHIKVLLRIWLHSESFISVQSVLNTALFSVAATITILVQSIFVKPYLHFKTVYIHIFYQKHHVHKAISILPEWILATKPLPISSLLHQPYPYTRRV